MAFVAANYWLCWEIDLDMSLGFTAVRLASPMIEEGGGSDWSHETSLPLQGDPEEIHLGDGSSIKWR